jgi:bile acid:Na+ symporter, BASS family
MEGILQVILKVSLVLFMVGNLLGMGLELALRDALAALRNVRFLVLSLVWCFVMCPAFAWFVVRVVPMEGPYGVGLLLMGLTPCAPFMPMMVRRARGDMAYTAAFLLLSAAGTVLIMPFAVPVMVQGMTVTAWIIAKPLLFFVLAPLALGVTVKALAPRAALRTFPAVKWITSIVTLAMLVVMVLLYWRGMAGAIGSFALAAQVLYLGAVASGAYYLGFGLEKSQRSVISLGLCTRNFGAALAPLMAVRDADPRATIMIVIGVPVTVALSFVFAGLFAKDAGP